MGTRVEFECALREAHPRPPQADLTAPAGRHRVGHRGKVGITTTCSRITTSCSWVRAIPPETGGLLGCVVNLPLAGGRMVEGIIILIVLVLLWLGVR